MYPLIITTVLILVQVVLIKGQTLSLSGSNTGDYALIGHNFTFNCEINGGDKLDTIEFKKNGTPVCEINFKSCTQNGFPGYKCGCDESGYVLYLKIQDVDVADEAIWTCYSSVHSNTIHLAVYDDLKAVVLSTSSLKSVYEGEDLDSVKCSAHCRPACSVAWYKDTTANVIPSLNGVLALHALNRIATGSYFCIATHSKLNKSMTSSKLNLNVYFGPDPIRINQTDSTFILEGRTLEPVSCFSGCNPPCSSHWYKDQINSTNLIPTVNGLLKLTDINRSQSGSYFCRVLHEISSHSVSKGIIIDVQYPPDRLNLNPIKMEPILEGGNVKVKCTVNCNPTCTLSWYKDGISPSNLISSHNGVLELSNVNRTQSGNYICQAVYNLTGMKLNSSLINLLVHYGPDDVSFNQSTVIGVMEGEAVGPVICKADCNPLCSFSWHKQASTFVTKGNILQLTNSRSESGSYFCQAYNNVTKQQSKINLIDIDVYYGPDDVSFNQSTGIGVMEGEAVGPVICKADCNPLCSFSWHKQASTFVTKGNILQLKNSSRSESGSYFCQAYNNVTKQQSKSNLIDIDVYYGPDDVSFNQSTFIGEMEGEAVGPVICKADCNPICSFSWHKQASTFVTKGNILQLKNSSRSESGSYFCQAYNNVTKQQSRSNLIDIDVYYGPGVVSLNQTTVIGVIESGAVGPVICQADCNPICSFSWHKQANTFVTKGNILQLTNSSRSESGSYFCQAYNNVTKQQSRSNLIDIDVYYGPINITLSPTSLQPVEEGSNVSLTCSAECNPNCDYVWYKDTATDTWTRGNQLSLLNVNRTENGTYVCRTTNPRSALKHQTASVIINVIFPPVLATWKTYEEIDKDTTNVTMNCDAISNPPATISWFRDVGGNSIGIGNQHTVEDVTCEDPRNYSCVAENGVGSRITNQFFLYIPCSALSTHPAPTTEVYINFNSTVQSTLGSSSVATTKESISTLSQILIGIVVVVVIICVGLCVFFCKRNTCSQIVKGRQKTEEDIELKDEDHRNHNCTQNHVQETVNVCFALGNGSRYNESSSNEHYNRCVNSSNSQTDLKQIGCEPTKEEKFKIHIYNFAEESLTNTPGSSNDSTLVKSRALIILNKSSTPNEANTSQSAEAHKLKLFHPCLSNSGSARESAMSLDESESVSGSSASPYKSTEVINAKSPSCSCHNKVIDISDA